LTRRLLAIYSRHQCFGEAVESPYFWGDLCLEKIKQIRLFRTRDTNTLAANPAMPYFEEHKPFASGWFSATKRSFGDCTTDQALSKLTNENGLTMLYQYLHRYADLQNYTVQPKFKAAAERLRAFSGIWISTVSSMMDRLRLVQGIFIAYRQNRGWIVNTNAREAQDLQIVLPPGISCNEIRFWARSGFPQFEPATMASLPCRRDRAQSIQNRFQKGPGKNQAAVKSRAMGIAAAFPGTGSHYLARNFL